MICIILRNYIVVQYYCLYLLYCALDLYGLFTTCYKFVPLNTITLSLSANLFLFPAMPFNLEVGSKGWIGSRWNIFGKDPSSVVPGTPRGTTSRGRESQTVLSHKCQL